MKRIKRVKPNVKKNTSWAAVLVLMEAALQAKQHCSVLKAMPSKTGNILGAFALTYQSVNFESYS